MMPASPLRFPQLDYLARGISVLPIRAGSKKPFGKWRRWMTERMTEAQARSWWATMRPTPNVGVIGGAVSGDLVILDVEPEHVAFVLREIGDKISPATPRVQTARGGLHLYYRGVEGCGKLQIAGRTVGDVRGEGGYVVAPPSVTADGAYVWTHHPRWDPEFIPPLPRWIEIRTSTGGDLVAPPTGGAPWAPDVLAAYLPSHLRKCVREGFRLGGAFRSPSELDFRVMCEVIHAGADWESIQTFYRAMPFGVNAERHAQRDRNYLVRTYRGARERIAHEIDAAVDVKCFRIVSANGRIVGGAKLRALVEFLDREGELRQHSIPVVLGPPYDGELAGEWLQVLSAYGAEPTDDTAALDGNTWVPAIVSGPRIYRLVCERTLELVL